MEKLVNAKKIMDATSNIKRGDYRETPQMMTREFEVPQAKYNIPQEYLQEQPSSEPLLSSIPRENTKPVGVPTVDAIRNSKLPDEIKKLMMEHPIAQPQSQQQVTLSDDLVEKAARLMKTQDNNYIPESAKSKQIQKTQTQTSGFDYNIIKKMIEEAVDKALEKNGLLVESAEKTNELFSFKVGKHIFEGKVTKIKKLS